VLARERSQKRQAGSGRRSGACSRCESHANNGARQLVAMAVAVTVERPSSSTCCAGAERGQRSHERRRTAHVPLAKRPQQFTTMEAMNPRPRQCGPTLAMCCVLEPTTQMHTLATNQSPKACGRVTVPRGQSARREDTAPEGAAEEKTAPSGASAAAMGVDGVSFREKLDRETHRSRNLKCAAGRHPPFQLRLLYIPPSAVTPTTCSRVSIL